MDSRSYIFCVGKGKCHHDQHAEDHPDGKRPCTSLGEGVSCRDPPNVSMIIQ